MTAPAEPAYSRAIVDQLEARVVNVDAVVARLATDGAADDVSSIVPGAPEPPD